MITFEEAALELFEAVLDKATPKDDHLIRGYPVTEASMAHGRQKRRDRIARENARFCKAGLTMLGVAFHACRFGPQGTSWMDVLEPDEEEP